VRFGLQLHADRGVDAVIQEARLADTQGFDSVWTGDHLMSTRGEDVADRPLDSFTLMTAIGAVTQRVRLAFATLNPSFRNPAVLAKMLATLDQITHGRVICTLGAGWFEGEYSAYNVPFIADHTERIEQEREVVALFKQLWTHPAPAKTTFEGRHVSVRELPFNPAPFQQPHPPIWIGGNSGETLQLVKEAGDGWMLLSAGGVRDVIAEARSQSDWPSRQMEIVAGAHVFVADSADAADRAARAAFDAGRVPFVQSINALLQAGIIGTPEVVLARCAELENWGVTYLRVTFADASLQTLFAEHVLPRVRSAEAVGAGAAS
jgi:alkanesulfonate monooxygenase SsuD/methylene tetrahydromethanopterin reductase-like flavin-dependent oxidoreductase (luciferase family)